MSAKGGAKRKQPSSSGVGGSRAQRNKLASKAAKRSKAVAAARPQRDDNEELGGGLLFDSDDEDGEDGEDLRIRAPRGAGGDSDDEDGAVDDDDEPTIDPFAHETPDEKRVRLTREYLKQVEQSVDEEEAAVGSEDDEEAAEERHGITRDAAIETRLKKDLAAQRGTLKQVVAHRRYDASSFPVEQSAGWTRHRPAHKKGGATCIAMTEDSASIYTGGKDCNVVAWDTETGKKVYTMFGNVGGKYPHNPGHADDILTISVSGDGNFLATGGKDGAVKIWDPRAQYSCVRTFPAHKGPVNAVAFRMGSHQLFTGGADRTVKIWNIDQLAFVETLYGHTSDVTCIDSLYKDRCLSVSCDKTSRLWKVVEESQLMFRASVYAESLDAVAMVNEDQFLTGGQDGTVCAWMTSKKKPTSVLQQAHGGKWINCVGAQKFTVSHARRRWRGRLEEGRRTIGTSRVGADGGALSSFPICLLSPCLSRTCVSPAAATAT